MPLTRMVMIGGFLGAGKTTALGQLARVYARMGRRVVMITNDQATDLVDTQTLRRQGFEVGEVPNACFCCAFPDLLSAADQLTTSAPTDIILGEPVGSCTDLAATVVQPLKRLHADRFDVTPLVVLVDPQRAREALEVGDLAGFSPKVAYIYEKQLEEANVIAINKIDTLAPADVESLTRLIRDRFPRARVVPISARTGEGLERLIGLLEGQGEAGDHPAEVDYDIYAEGEAELGWYNGSLTVSGSEPFDLDSWLLDLVDRIGSALRQAGAGVAHLKVMASTDGSESVANLVRGDGPAEVSRPSHQQARQADLLVNARVVLDPDELAQVVDRIVSQVASNAGLQVAWISSRRLRPGRPVPTHRFAGR
jgi:G3E family GTPase